MSDIIAILRQIYEEFHLLSLHSAYHITLHTITHILNKVINLNKSTILSSLVVSSSSRNSAVPEALNPINLVGIDDLVADINDLFFGHEPTTTTTTPTSTTINSTTIPVDASVYDPTSLLDISIPSGLLIHGPTGSGKTVLAQYIAYTCRHTYKCISLSCSDLVHKVVGESEQHLSGIFAAG